MKIIVLYSLPTRRALASPYRATDEDTEDSAKEVYHALKNNGADPELVAISEEHVDKILSLRADCIFNLIEWDGLDLPLSLAAFGNLESLGIPFTGATLANLSIVSDKIKMKEALDIAKLPTPAWQLFTTGDEQIQSDLSYPIIVKLAWEHCSVGLTRDAVVADSTTLRNVVKERIAVFHQPVYLEEFIEGQELQVSILDREDGLTILPPAEITFIKHGKEAFLTFEGRWNEDHPDYGLSGVSLAYLSENLQQLLTNISLETFRQLGFRDYSRLDVRCRDGKVYILEANANPGLGDDEDYGMTVSYRAAGMTFDSFVWEIVKSCLRRSG